MLHIEKKEYYRRYYCAVDGTGCVEVRARSKEEAYEIMRFANPRVKKSWVRKSSAKATYQLRGTKETVRTYSFDGARKMLEQRLWITVDMKQLDVIR